jgi:membrane protein involved in colicin uptake
MTPFRALTLACLLAAPALAGAQWMYLDKDGRKVFSDKAPPPETPPGKILRQPGMKKPAADATQASAPAQAAAAPASAPKISGKDKELEERRKQAEAAEAEKNKARAEAQAKVQAENCGRARQMKATLDSGQRIARMNAKGEREIMDDAQRAAEAKRIDGIIAADCKTAQ